MQVVTARAEVNSLRSYKYRQYHVNESRIAQLRKEIEQAEEMRKVTDTPFTAGKHALPWAVTSNF